MTLFKRKKTPPAPADANALQYSYFQEYQSCINNGDNAGAMRSLIRHIHCLLAYNDTAYYFDVSDKLSDDESVSPVAKKFMRENAEFYDDSLVDECRSIPLASPPSADRVKALVHQIIAP